MKALNTLFPLKVLLDNNFHQFVKSLGKSSSKTCQIETSFSINFHEDISQYNSFKNSNDY